MLPCRLSLFSSCFFCRNSSFFRLLLLYMVERLAIVSLAWLILAVPAAQIRAAKLKVFAALILTKTLKLSL